MNIVRVRTTLPVIDNPDVMPVDSPTVPKAETVSNKILIKEVFSVRDKIITATATQVAAIKVTPTAFDIVSLLIFLLNKFTWLLPFRMETTYSKRTPNVDVFIPPPVLPGDAPININIIITSSEAFVIDPISIVLNPVVVDAEII